MRVLFTTVSLDAQRGGGTAERTRRLVRAFLEAGHECMVAAIEGGDLARELVDLGVEVYVSGHVRVRFTLPLIAPGTLWSMVRKADAIHVLGYWNLLSVATTQMSRLLHKPYVLSAAGEFVGLVDPKPAAAMFHRVVGQGMIGAAASIVAITELEREQILSRFVLAPERVVVVPNGVTEPASTEDRVPALPAGLFILFLGRLADVKGPDLLVAAFKDICTQFPQVSLVMAGPDFGLGQELREAAETPPLAGRVIFTDYLDESQKTAVYRAAAFLAVPSRAEAMSLVALEAGVVGTPVLLTDQCGFDQVGQLGGGLVVPATIEGLRGGLEEMLTRVDELPEMGQKLRRFVLQAYTWRRIAARLADHLAALPLRKPTLR